MTRNAITLTISTAIVSSRASRGSGPEQLAEHAEAVFETVREAAEPVRCPEIGNEPDAVGPRALVAGMWRPDHHAARPVARIGDRGRRDHLTGGPATAVRRRAAIRHVRIARRDRRAVHAGGAA